MHGYVFYHFFEVVGPRYEIRFAVYLNQNAQFIARVNVAGD
jgi:hypothetical protein